MARDTISLFDNERDANLKASIEMIENALIALGHVVAESRCEKAGAERCWRLAAGSAQVDVELIDDRAPAWALRASASVMTASAGTDRPALFRHLLEKNAAAVTGAAFALRDDTVILIAERSTVDLDQTEVSDLITRVQQYADQYDDALVEAFGGELGAGA